MITVSHIFYGQHEMLPIHESAWSKHDPDSALYTIVDDGSPRPLPSSFGGEKVSIYRVDQDIPWNIAGARNLAFHTAKTDWVFCGDVDHVITAQAMFAISQLDLSDRNRAYTFRRRNESGYVGVDAIINILMNKARFFEIGGYDEDYSGHYGREETFFDQCLRYHKVAIIRCDNIYLDWYPKLGQTRNLPRDKSRNAILFDKKIGALQSGKYVPPRILRFGWHPVSH